MKQPPAQPIAFNAASTDIALLEEAYRHFNDALFGGALPPVYITLRCDRRYKAYARQQAFVKRWKSGIEIDEIAFNSEFIDTATDFEILMSLAHEMCHIWQFNYGTPPRNGHNREWAEKMIEVGLMPSSTGAPGGAQTGRMVGEYSVSDSPFRKAAEEIVSKFRIGWGCLSPEKMNGSRVAGQDNGTGEVNS